MQQALSVALSLHCAYFITTTLLKIEDFKEYQIKFVANSVSSTQFFKMVSAVFRFLMICE
jgi:hypothetical protein